MVTDQAQIIAYIDDFKLLMILTLLALPLCVFFRKPPPGTGSEPSVPAH
jgi:DHA2 family multidrug resistance protein